MLVNEPKREVAYRRLGALHFQRVAKPSLNINRNNFIFQGRKILSIGCFALLYQFPEGFVVHNMDCTRKQTQQGQQNLKKTNQKHVVCNQMK